MTEKIAVSEEAGDAGINVGRTDRVRDITVHIRSLLDIERQARIGWCADIARGEIGEQRIFSWSTIAMTGVAFRLAVEQIVAELFLSRKLCRARLYRVVFRGERRHLGGYFIVRDGLRHLVERGVRAASIDGVEP